MQPTLSMDPWYRFDEVKLQGEFLVASGQRRPYSLLEAQDAELKRETQAVPLWQQFAEVRTPEQAPAFAKRFGLLGLAAVKGQAVILEPRPPAIDAETLRGELEWLPKETVEKLSKAPWFEPKAVVTAHGTIQPFMDFWARYCSELPPEPDNPLDRLLAPLIHAKRPRRLLEELAQRSDREPVREWLDEAAGLHVALDKMADARAPEDQRRVAAEFFAARLRATPSFAPDGSGRWHWHLPSLLDGLYLLAYMDLGPGRKLVFRCEMCGRYLTSRRVGAGKTGVRVCRRCAPRYHSWRWKQGHKVEQTVWKRARRDFRRGLSDERIIDRAREVPPERVRGWLSRWRSEPGRCI